MASPRTRPDDRVSRRKRCFEASPCPESHQVVGSSTLPHNYGARYHQADIPSAKRPRVKEEHHDVQHCQGYSAGQYPSLSDWSWESGSQLLNPGMQGENHVATGPTLYAVQVPTYTSFQQHFSNGLQSFQDSFPALPDGLPTGPSVTNELPFLGSTYGLFSSPSEATPAQFALNQIYEKALDGIPEVPVPSSHRPWPSYPPPILPTQIDFGIPYNNILPTPQPNLFPSSTLNMSYSSLWSTRHSSNSSPTFKSESSYGPSDSQSECNPCAPDTPTGATFTPMFIGKNVALSSSLDGFEPVRQLQSAPSNVSIVKAPSPPVADLAKSWELVGKLEEDLFPEQSLLVDQVSDTSHVDIDSYVDIGRELPHYNSLPEVANGQGRKTRYSMGEIERKGISVTRKLGACLRCHMQRTKCVMSSDDPLADCETCLRFDKRSKKTIHNLPCLRWKLTTITMYRIGGLGLTKRFDGTKLAPNIPIIRSHFVIEVAHALPSKLLTLEIGRFEPIEGDVVARRYGDGKEAHYAPYCLHRVQDTAKELKRYFNDNALDALTRTAKREPGLIGRTLKMVMTHYCALSDSPNGGNTNAKRFKNGHERKQLLADAIRLWFAIHTGIGSSSVVNNVESLEMERPDDDAPFRDQHSIPRMIVAQVDTIRHEICGALVPKVLRLYENILASKNTEAWFTIYLVTFLFLGLVSSASADRLRHARQRFSKPETRYGHANSPMTNFVEQLQTGGAVLLAYWQYFKRVDLMDENFKWEDPSGTALKALTAEQLDFLKLTVNDLKTISGTIPREPSEGCWESPLFWISRMFESAPSGGPSWSPPETFSCIKPSVGRFTAVPVADVHVD